MRMCHFEKKLKHALATLRRNVVFRQLFITYLLKFVTFLSLSGKIFDKKLTKKKFRFNAASAQNNSKLKQNPEKTRKT